MELDETILAIEREDASDYVGIDSFSHNGKNYDLELAKDGVVQINGLHDVTAGSFTEAMELIQSGNV
jgi:hypothetical protein